jgi:succinoglycan biosynthesis transport protein ExoP
VEFWRYYRIIRRRRWLIILGMVICVGAVAMHNYTSVPLYTGRTTLVESKSLSREGIPLYPDMPVYGDVVDVQLRLSNLGTIATSNKVMQDAAEVLSDLGSRYTPEEILSNTKVAPVRDTNILSIEVTLPDPTEAKKAADVVASALKNVYDDLNNASVRQSREFIEAQLQTTKRAMIKAQNALRRFKEENEVVMLDQQSVASIQRMSQVKSELSAATAAYEAASASVATLEEELKSLPEWYTMSKQTSRDPMWQDLTAQLAKLESEKAAMTTGRSGQQYRLPNHPQVQAVQYQIDDIRKQLMKIEREYTAAVAVGKNPNRINAVDRWVLSNVDKASSHARRLAMEQVLGEVRADMAKMPAKEARLAELTTDVQAATETYGLMRKKLDEARIKEQQVRDERSLKTIDQAYVYPVNQRQVMKLVVALILSPLLGIGVAFLLYYTDNTIKTAPEAEKLLGLPVYSVVPNSRAHSLPRQRCPEIVDIAYQMLTSSLWIASQEQGVTSVVLVSAEPDVGRSVTASNLSVALAREGARVVLVDADFRQPTQHLIFGVDNKVGLSNLLSGGATLEDVLVPTKVQGLLVVPTGPVPGNPVKLLKSPEMKDFVEQTREVADFVIYDTPAGVAFPDPVLVAAQVGSAVVVHSAGRVPRGSEAELRARLESVGVRLLGAVLNKVRREDSSGYFHYRRSYEGIRIGQSAGDKKALKGSV